jgi:hypothetical protein
VPVTYGRFLQEVGQVAFVDIDGIIKPIEGVKNVEVTVGVDSGTKPLIELFDPKEFYISCKADISTTKFLTLIGIGDKLVGKSEHYAKHSKRLRIRRKHNKRLLNLVSLGFRVREYNNEMKGWIFR